jgi:quercetin dioxygenase-like cupin family protein
MALRSLNVSRESVSRRLRRLGAIRATPCGADHARSFLQLQCRQGHFEASIVESRAFRLRARFNKTPFNPAAYDHQALFWISPEGAMDERALIDMVVKRFEAADEIHEFARGRFEVVRIGGFAIGRATYEPGWRWSEHVGPTISATRCTVEHIGLVVAGAATAAFDDGRIVELSAGDLFYIPPIPHDSWVIGERPYVSLHLLGTEGYAVKGGNPADARDQHRRDAGSHGTIQQDAVRTTA